MSSTNQYSSTQKSSSDSRQSPFEIAQRIATLMGEATERLFKVQSEAANETFTESTEYLQSLLKNTERQRF